MVSGQWSEKTVGKGEACQGTASGVPPDICHFALLGAEGFVAHEGIDHCDVTGIAEAMP